MQKNKPLVSIIINCYNGEQFLPQCIKSIQKQTYKHLEIIVVNNGADQEITDYINLLSQKDSRVKILHYSENLYDEDNPALDIASRYKNKTLLKAAPYTRSDRGIPAMDPP